MTQENYQNAVQKIELSEEQKDRLLQESLRSNQPRGNCLMMKKKLVLVAAAAVVVMSITAVAVSGLVTSWVSSCSAQSDYTSLPTAQQCEKKVGYTPILLEQFENGYAFQEGSIVSNTLESDSGAPVEKFKSLDFQYEKNGDTVDFSQEKYKTEMAEEGTAAAVVDGVTFYYYSYTNKSVPPEYEMTEQDKQLEQSGDLVFSYGSDKVSVEQVQSVSWSVGDMHYNLMQMDGALSKDALLAMAEEALAS